MVSISKKNVNVRSGPGKKYDVIWEIEKDYPLMILKSKGKWLKVKDYENDEGWVYQPLTSTTPYLIVKHKKVKLGLTATFLLKSSLLVYTRLHGVC